VPANHILQNFPSAENFPEWKWAWSKTGSTFLNIIIRQPCIAVIEPQSEATGKCIDHYTTSTPYENERQHTHNHWEGR
jgi:hypothetical protein